MKSKCTISAIIVESPTPPPPPFVGTKFRVRIPADSLAFEFYSISLDTAKEEGMIDWGDGNTEIVTTNGKRSHAYAEGGEYTIALADDFRRIKISDTSDDPYTQRYSETVLSIVSNASLWSAILPRSYQRCTNMAQLDISASGVEKLTAGVFRDCPAVTGRIDLPNVAEIVGDEPQFVGCSGITEIHFAAKNEEAIRNSESFKVDPKLGAANAVVFFDL